MRFCHADGEFEHMRGNLSELGIELNTASQDEHVPEIERYIRTMKDRMRSDYNMLPFKKMPARMIIEMATRGVLW